jgi:hypothetical protein
VSSFNYIGANRNFKDYFVFHKVSTISNNGTLCAACLLDQIRILARKVAPPAPTAPRPLATARLNTGATGIFRQLQLVS